MRSRFKIGIILTLPFQLLAVNWMSAHREWVEHYYSKGLYPYISGFFRRLYGWIPFSVGDVLYFFLIVAVCVYVIRKWYWIRNHMWSFIGDILVLITVIHFTFYLLWGSNYFRVPLSRTLGYEIKYTTQELVLVTEQLIGKTNSLQEKLAGNSEQAVAIPHSRKDILNKTISGYQNLAETFPGLRYETPSLKPSLFSTLLTYMGYGGYLNPFTAEAQVNHLLPSFRYPVVSGHEVGHQLGYSAENETNFIGYLVTLRNPDIYFQYSASAYGLSYCLSEIRRRDKAAYEMLLTRINPGVRANYRQLSVFWKAYENPMEPIFKSIFNQYLEINKQKDGIRSYNRVVALIVGYHRLNPVHP